MFGEFGWNPAWCFCLESGLVILAGIWLGDLESGFVILAGILLRYVVGIVKATSNNKTPKQTLLRDVGWNQQSTNQQRPRKHQVTKTNKAPSNNKSPNNTNQQSTKQHKHTKHPTTKTNEINNKRNRQDQHWLESRLKMLAGIRFSDCGWNPFWGDLPGIS
jgi:hypothetical protein